ncbi:MAG TPA: hypothetical protein VGZ47_19105, partial [Gemmataceae bacterium]|nr:hypothetical protein [Gemmataceae bacterium]
MTRRCIYLMLAGALLQAPAVARADSRDDEIEKLKKELESARKQVEKLQAERDKLLKRAEDRDNESARKEMEKLKAERDKLHQKETLERLLKKYEELMKENGRHLPGEYLWDPPPREDLIPKPPSDEIKGAITGVADNLATISIGSDQGVKVDQVFQVYRLQPEAEYLGTLRITNVETHRAAG